jgi:hypothetical protein
MRLEMSKLVGNFLVAILLILLGGCNDDIMPPIAANDTLIVTISTDKQVFSYGDTVVVTVTAENPTESTITFTYGSSSCSLHSVVTIDEREYSMSEDRWCTMDAGPQSIGPGRSITERWNWYGSIRIDYQDQPLPDGIYSIKGKAGEFVGEAIPIAVAD